MPRPPTPTPSPGFTALSGDALCAAVAERNPRFDGSFVYSVVTTGVYCRPSCPGRPKRENVRFHATWAEAEAAGFRPCKRCKPKGAPSP
jgi:AraC family transcriptional regulator, regulatory protein of adaptative response / methylated-DNA-[protein]-cysteine methyltransferase